MDLIQRAADSARESSSRASETINDLSLQLQTANSRIRDLEATIEEYQIRAERAEKWFTAVSSEIHRQFDEVDTPDQMVRQFRIASSER